MRELGTTSIAEAVAEKIRGQLYARRFAPGQVLKDTALAETFAVARATARAAVQALVAEGLLIRNPGHSARVPDFSAADIRDFFRARWAVEWAAVERYIAGEGVLAPAETSLAELARAVAGEWRQVADADVQFHRAMVAGIGSKRLLGLFDTLAVELRLMIALLEPSYPQFDAMLAEHQELLAALRSGDTRRCRTAWRDHFDAAINMLTATRTQGATRETTQ